MATARKLIEPLEVHISPMRRRHLRSVLRIESQVYPTPWTHGLFVSELALRSTAFVRDRARRSRGDRVRRADDVARATGTSRRSRSIPTGSGRAIGTRLLLALAREAIARGATALTLEVRLSHRGAQQLYQRFGFTAVGVRKGYYADTGEDALIMWAHEVDQPEYAALLDRLERRRAGHDRVRTPEELVTVRILGIETSCDETAAAVVDDGRDDPLVGRVEPGRSARALRRRRARDREPGARRARQRRDRRRRSSKRASTLADIDAVAAVHGPGPRGRAARRRERGEGDRARDRVARTSA